MKTLLTVLVSLLFVAAAEAQVTCMQLGKFLTCDGPRGQNSTQMDMGGGRGVISGQSQYGAPSYMEPYAVLPPRAPQAPRAPLFVPFSNEAPRAPTSGGDALAPQAPRAPSSWEPIEPSVLTQPW